MNFVFKSQYRLYRWISGLRHWFPRRFTTAGLTLIGAFLVTTIIAFDIENFVAYQAFTLLLCMLIGSVLFSIGFRGRFSAERSLPRCASVGTPFTYRVKIKNLTRKNQTGLSLLEDLADPRPSFIDWKALHIYLQKHVRPFRFAPWKRPNPFRLATTKSTDLPPVPPQQDVETTIQIIPLRRGIVRLKGLILARPDPLGLFRAFVRIALPQSVLVLPKRHLLPNIPLPGAMMYQQGGVALASNIGRSDEFVALRDYRSGDPMRHIHWRSWAKTGKPIVREYEDEFFVRHALVLDTFTNAPFSDQFEDAVSVAASFASTALTQESLLDLLFVGSQAYCFTAGRGLAHADQILEILASVQTSPSKPFNSLEHLVLNHIGAVSGCICVLLSWDQERRDLVKKIKTLGIPVLVLVVLPPGETALLEYGPMADEPHRLHALHTGHIKEQLLALK